MGIFRKPPKSLFPSPGEYPPDENEKGWRHPPVDSTLGWRGWLWDGACLLSPVQKVKWTEPELRCESWSKDNAVRGKSGIHALWPVPKDWQNANDGHFETGVALPVVVGVVERFGHYVLGEDGWRAEWVIIKELAAPQSIMAEVRKAYPDLTVHERKDYYASMTPPINANILFGRGLFIPQSGSGSNTVVHVASGNTFTVPLGANCLMMAGGAPGELVVIDNPNPHPVQVNDGPQSYSVPANSKYTIRRTGVAVSTSAQLAQQQNMLAQQWAINNPQTYQGLMNQGLLGMQNYLGQQQAVDPSYLNAILQQRIKMWKNTP